MKSQLNSIQILRFFAAFFVVLFHAHNFVMRHVVSHKATWLDGLFDVGAAGVYIFFMISGFVMAFIAMRPGKAANWWNFLKRRCARIYPIYWMVAMAYVIAHILLGTPYRLGITELFGAIFLLQDGSSSIIGPGWTLAYEVFFYAAFAACLLLPKRGQLPCLAMVLIGLVTAGVISPDLRSALGIYANPLTLEFLSGAVLGFVHVRGYRLPPQMALVAIALALIAFALSPYAVRQGVPTVPVWGVLSACLLLGMINAEAWMGGAVFRRLSRLGDASYFLYLIHILVLTLVESVWTMPVRDSGLLMSLVSVAIALACVPIALAGHLFCEVPLLTHVQRLTDRIEFNVLTGRMPKSDRA